MAQVKSPDTLEQEWTRFLVAKHLPDIHSAFPDMRRAMEYHRVLGLAIEWQYQKGRSRRVDWDGQLLELAVRNNRNREPPPKRRLRGAGGGSAVRG